MASRIIDPIHFSKAEEIASEMLQKMGYLVQPLGYHSYFTDTTQTAIQNLNTPTALFLRTLPDRLIIKSGTALLAEIKDVQNPQYENLSLEAFPLIIQRHLFWLYGIKTIYLFVMAKEMIKGCPVEELPVFRVILPTHVKNQRKAYWRPLLQQSFPLCHPEEIPVGGSSDPFILISHAQIQLLHDM